MNAALFSVWNNWCQESRNEVQKLLRTKKKSYFESKPTQNIGKPKELWKCLKPWGLKFESSISNINNDKSVNVDIKDIAKNFSAYFLNLAENLVNKLPILQINMVYYSHLGLTKKFELLPTEKDHILNILRDLLLALTDLQEDF